MICASGLQSKSQTSGWTPQWKSFELKNFSSVVNVFHPVIIWHICLLKHSEPWVRSGTSFALVWAVWTRLLSWTCVYSIWPCPLVSEWWCHEMRGFLGSHSFPLHHGLCTGSKLDLWKTRCLCVGLTGTHYTLCPRGQTDHPVRKPRLQQSDIDSPHFKRKMTYLKAKFSICNFPSVCQSVGHRQRIWLVTDSTTHVVIWIPGLTSYYRPNKGKLNGLLLFTVMSHTSGRGSSSRSPLCNFTHGNKGSRV